MELEEIIAKELLKIYIFEISNLGARLALIYLIIICFIFFCKKLFLLINSLTIGTKKSMSTRGFIPFDLISTNRTQFFLLAMWN